MHIPVFTNRNSFKMRLVILVLFIIALLTVGTLFYHEFEGWSYSDGFYFSAISLTTRGYGELHPTQTISKIFTAFYLFLGVAFILYALSSFISYYIQYKEPMIHKKVDSFVKTISPPKKERWIMLKANKKERETPSPKKVEEY